jgi:F-type H+-transporting ATPase subunit a
VTIYSPLEHAGVPVLVQAVTLGAVLLMATGVLLKRQIAAASHAGVLPDEGVTLRNVLELIVGGIADLAEQNMGPEYRRWFPLVGTIFFFILVSNIMGLVPGIGGSTSFVETTTAWALISVAVSEFVGIQRHGAHYVKHFLGPILWLAPVFFILEVPLHLARVLTLSVRLLANMFADHTIVGVWVMLVPIGIPALFMGLGLVVAILQAFVFALLTMIYIGTALQEAH